MGEREREREPGYKSIVLVILYTMITCSLHVSCTFFGCVVSGVGIGWEDVAVSAFALFSLAVLSALSFAISSFTFCLWI